MSGVGLVCDRGIPARAAIRVVPSRFRLVAVKRRFGAWARGVGFAVLRTGRDGMGWLRTMRSAVALLRRRGADSKARRAVRPVAADRLGAYGNGARGEGSGFWMRNVRGARDVGDGCSKKLTDDVRAQRREGPSGSDMPGAPRVGGPLGRLGRTTGAARPFGAFGASPRKLVECYLVDPASSHMLVSKIKPCMCKYERIQTVKLRMAH